MKKNRKLTGFTLVEIIVTLVILAVLAAFTFPAMLGWVTNSREKLCQTARYDIQRYYKTQAVGDRPATESEAKVVLQKAVVNSYGASNFSSDGLKAVGICPSGGEYPLNDTNIKYTESDGIFYEVADITCTKHGNIRPNLTSTKSLLEKLKESWKGDWQRGQSNFLEAFKEANNGKFDTVDEVDLINAFGDNWKETLYQKPDALYWRPYTLMVSGEKSNLTYASNQGNDANNIQGNWKAALIEFNGKYYVSTKETWDKKIGDGDVAALKGQSFENDAAVIKWLEEHEFKAVEN